MPCAVRPSCDGSYISDLVIFVTDAMRDFGTVCTMPLMHLMMSGSPLLTTMPVIVRPSVVFTSLPSKPCEIVALGSAMACTMMSVVCCLPKVERSGPKSTPFAPTRCQV